MFQLFCAQQDHLLIHSFIHQDSVNRWIQLRQTKYACNRAGNCYIVDISRSRLSLAFLAYFADLFVSLSYIWSNSIQNFPVLIGGFLELKNNRKFVDQTRREYWKDIDSIFNFKNLFLYVKHFIWPLYCWWNKIWTLQFPLISLYCNIIGQLMHLAPQWFADLYWLPPS